MAHDSSSFSAGQVAGTRIAACVARLAALELTDQSRWWNRRRRRLQADALVACAEELECAADADGRPDAEALEGGSTFRPVLVAEARERRLRRAEAAAGVPSQAIPART